MEENRDQGMLLQQGLTISTPVTLRYASKPKSYSVPSAAIPFAGVIDGLRVKEKHEPHEPPTPYPNLGDYTITIERKVRSSDELHHWTHSIRLVVDKLDKLWP